MERISFEIERQDIAEALHETAEAHGRTVEEELAALVEKTYLPKAGKPAVGENSIQKLIRLGRGLDLQVPPRAAEDYEPPRLG